MVLMADETTALYDAKAIGDAACAEVIHQALATRAPLPPPLDVPIQALVALSRPGVG
jgi:hypothetical protein